MGLTDYLQHLTDSKTILAGASAIAGALFTRLVAIYRNRIRSLEYTVAHDRVGVSADDAVHGSVRVTWQGHAVTNLFTSVVTLENRTSTDFVNLKFKAFTGDDTLLLTQYTELPGTSFILGHTPEYEQELYVPAGSQPTPAQMDKYRHEREYLVPVLNRKQKAVIRFLTTVPNPSVGPAVWLDMLHPGLRVQYKPNVPRIHGVPVRIALSVGLAASVAILAFAALSLQNSWLIAVICMLAGLGAQSIGAFLYGATRLAVRLVVR